MMPHHNMSFSNQKYTVLKFDNTEAGLSANSLTAATFEEARPKAAFHKRVPKSPEKPYPFPISLSTRLISSCRECTLSFT